MHLVPKPQRAPGHCFYSAKNSDPDGFIDFGRPLQGLNPHLYLSVSGAREIGRYVGQVDEAAHEAVVAELEAAKAQVAELEAKVSELEGQVSLHERSVDYFFTQHDRKLGRPPGPTPAKKA